MKLKARISRKYLNQIIKAEKNVEYRNVESIILFDGKRKREFRVRSIYAFNPDTSNFSSVMDSLRNRFKDVEWKDDEPLLEIYLGESVSKVKQ